MTTYIRLKRRTLFSLFLILFLNTSLFALPDWFLLNAWVDFSLQKTDFKTLDSAAQWDLTASHNNAFVQAELNTPGGTLGADILLNLEQRYTKAYDNSKDEINFNVLKANASVNSRFVTFTAGRFFYGEKNTLRPYYGLYEDFLFSSGSSLDGGTLDFKSKYLDINLTLAKENDSSFAGDARGSILGLGAEIKAFKILRIGSQYDVFDRKNTEEDIKLSVLSLYGELTFFEKTKLYFEYAKNGGEAALAPLPPGIVCIDCNYKEKQPYGGSALLAKLSDKGESAYGEYEMHFLYVKGSGDKNNKYNEFADDNSFIYLGSIFTEMTFMQNYVNPNTTARYSALGNLQAYNLGAELSAGFLPALRARAEFYTYAMDDSFAVSKDLGSEMDFALIYSPYYKLDIMLGYAQFSAGSGLNETTPGAPLDKIAKYEARLAYRF